jgi:MFS family permease
MANHAHDVLYRHPLRLASWHLRFWQCQNGTGIPLGQRQVPTAILGNDILEYGCGIVPTYLVPQVGWISRFCASCILFLMWLFQSAFASNFATLVIARFFGGGASAIVIHVVGSSITDIWKRDRDKSLLRSVSGMTSVVGISLGPLLGASSNGILIGDGIYIFSVSSRW